MARSVSRWRAHAEQVIRRVASAARAEGLDEDAVRRRVDAAYPFGERRYHPYTMWLKVRKELLGLPGLLSAADAAKLAAWQADAAKLAAWQAEEPIIDPGGPLSPLEQYLEEYADPADRHPHGEPPAARPAPEGGPAPPGGRAARQRAGDL